MSNKLNKIPAKIKKAEPYRVEQVECTESLGTVLDDINKRALPCVLTPGKVNYGIGVLVKVNNKTILKIPKTDYYWALHWAEFYAARIPTSVVLP